MAVLLGIVIGFILGAWLLSGISGGMAGALVGFIVTMAVRSRSQAREAQRTSPQARALAMPEPTTAHRLAAIERRLAALERGNGRLGDAPVVAAPPRPEPEPPATLAEVAQVAAAPSRSRNPCRNA